MGEKRKWKLKGLGREDGMFIGLVEKGVFECKRKEMVHVEITTSSVLSMLLTPDTSSGKIVNFKQFTP